MTAFFKDQKTCASSSMSPTLIPGDALHIIHYGKKSPGPGDVIVFHSENRDCLIVHRIHRKKSNGIKTRGDNNTLPDSWVVNPNEIIGYVASITRGSKRRPIRNGLPGRIEAAYRQLTKKLTNRISRALHPIYHFLANARLFSKPLSHRLQPQIYEFTRPDGPKQLHLYLNGKPVGRRRPNGAWHIRRPYRLFIDVTALP